ncbi:MAG: DUF2330 domain-containing protein [Thermoanaerobaculia bacterium]|nr:DUF2330 domain-containing protein [Thermoanaerobaculia bacterium]
MKLADRKSLFLLPFLLAGFLVASAGQAFCGFYAAKADTQLFNQASKVVLVRDGDRTVITMANDYRGAPEEFAIVVPVPTFLERDQIHVGDRGVIEHLDAYSAPRLVEYFDPDPCRPVYPRTMSMRAEEAPASGDVGRKSAGSFGVEIEAEYTVGEYDILILSAEESQGLETWLRQEGYRMPAGARKVLGSYLKQGMRFFVAKVNLEEQDRLGFSYLRPLQVAFESPKFMLPIRLGTVNSEGPQELFVFALTRTGRVETTNYRTVKLPTDMEIPEYVENDFGAFYRALFDQQVRRERMRTVVLEYAWDMGWCDPCAADPLSHDELRQLGVFWLDPGRTNDRFAPRRPMPGPADVFITRLHVRYTADTFPEDLRFQETGDRQNFQGRFILRRPWSGRPGQCSAARRYFEDLVPRQQQRAENLARLTGWELSEILARMDLGAAPAPREDVPWWKKLWASGEEKGGR